MQDLSKPCLINHWQYEPKRFAAQLKQLNRILGPLHDWAWRCARKDHEDHFGRPINKHDNYLARGDWGGTERLSVESAMALFHAMGLVEDTDQHLGSLCSYVTPQIQHELWDLRRTGASVG